LYEADDFANSAKKYKEAFDVLDGKANPNDRYNAACSYALAGNVDTSFYHLFRLANDSEYKDYGHITNDTYLDVLHGDQRWYELISIVSVNKQKAEVNFDKPLVALLPKIRICHVSNVNETISAVEPFGIDLCNMPLM
jgi:hypothetical protein